MVSGLLWQRVHFLQYLVMHSCYWPIGLAYSKKVPEKVISFFSMRNFRMPLYPIQGLCLVFHGFYFTYLRTGKPYETRWQDGPLIRMGCPYVRLFPNSL